MITCTCPLCGYVWEHSKDGSHECTTILKIQNNKLKDLLYHAWLHSRYHNCGYLKMSNDYKLLYDETIDSMIKKNKEK